MMEAAGTSTRKRKTSVALESSFPAPTADPGSGEEDDGGGGAGSGEDLDRISSLPDPILGEIISLLPTKEGARTQILASRWRHLWRSAPLNLDCRDLATWYELPSVLFLIISSHQGPGRRFCTSSVYTTIDLDSVEACLELDAVEACLLSPALDNLQELVLASWMGQPLPASAFRFSSTLSVAHIGHCCLPDFTVQEIHFPLLKHLELVHCSISEDSLHRMIAACPSLECLLILCCTGPRFLRITSLLLTSLGVSNSYLDAPAVTLNLGGVGNYPSDAPMMLLSLGLSNYSSDEPMLEEIIIESAPRLETFFHLHRNKELRVTVLSAPKLETLGCTISTRLVIGSTKIIQKGLRIDGLAPVVRTIKCLALCMPALSLDKVIEFLRCFPCLEKLYIQCDTPRKNKVGSHKHWDDLIGHHDIRLKTVVLNYYPGRMSPIGLVWFFILNARLLESMTIVVKTDTEKLLAKKHWNQQIENMASKGAQFDFTTQSRHKFGDINYVHDLDPNYPFEWLF